MYHKIKVESGYLYALVGGYPAVNFNRFDNYSMHVIRLQSIETVKSELNMVDEK